jgi:hypothetical protein
MWQAFEAAVATMLADEEGVEEDDGAKPLTPRNILMRINRGHITAPLLYISFPFCADEEDGEEEEEDDDDDEEWDENVPWKGEE